MSRVLKVLGDRLMLSALGVVLILVVCVAHIFAGVLDRPLTRTPDEVTVQLKSTGGLFEGSSVTYRGVQVGKVTRIAITETGVEATISLTADDEIPEDSLAVVRSLSPVGEQYLDFQPRSDGGPYLADGATVAAESTDIPLSLSSTVIALNKVLRQVDDRKLRTLLVELSDGLQGTGGDIGRTVDQAALLLDELDELYPATDRLLRNSDVALDIAIDKRGELESLATTAKRLTAFLRDYDPELEGTLERGPGQIETLQRLVDDARDVLPDFLSTGVSFSDILATHDPHIAALLQAYAPGLATLADHIEDGALNIELILDADPRCRYDISRRPPRDTSRRPLEVRSGCPASFSALQRGAAHAPGPVPR